MSVFDEQMIEQHEHDIETWLKRRDFGGCNCDDIDKTKCEFAGIFEAIDCSCACHDLNG